jgi:hypothetical protein
MDHPDDRPAEDQARSDPPPQDEAAIRAMLARSTLDIAEGRTVPLQPVLDRMRATAEAIRRGHAGAAGTAPRVIPLSSAAEAALSDLTDHDTARGRDRAIDLLTTHGHRS